jgi:hypothetical protein
VDGDFLEFGDVVEVRGTFEEAQDVTAARAAGRTVFVIRRAVIPGAESGGFRRRNEARRDVGVS